MTAAEQRAHVIELAAELGAHITWMPAADFGRASASTLSKRADLPEIEGDRADFNYGVALHELGHIAHRHQNDPFDMLFGSPELTAREAEAWAWALDTARGELNRDAAAASMGSYLKDARVVTPAVTRVLDYIGGESAAFAAWERILAARADAALAA